MQVGETIVGGISRGVGFFTRQQRDWKITVGRSLIARFSYQLVYPYLSIYTRELGATGTQLGMVNSIGMGVSGLTGPFIGWLIDRTGVKRIYLIGAVMITVSYLVYGLAQGWTIIIVAMVAYWLGMGIAGHSCTVICGNCLTSEERATGMAICETFGMGLLGMAAPMLGAWLVMAFGGINVEGIRPIFFVSVGGSIVTFFLILTQLSNRRWGSVEEGSSSFFEGIAQIFKQGRNLKRWLLIISITSLPMGMVMPFRQVFAHEVKGADPFILAAMVIAAGVVPLVLGIPLGRLADRIGRKKVIYLTMPFVWAANLMLIFAPNPGFLVVAGALQGFFILSSVTTAAITRELVPPEQMGRWMGILRLSSMLFSAGSVYLAGIIWDSIGPEWVFLTIIVTDILIRIPLLIGVPETLGSRLGTEQPE